MIWLTSYIATIFCANWAISTFGLVPVGFGLMAPAGVYFAGLAFTLRDMTQEALGKRFVVGAIAVGAMLSAFLSPALAVASGVAYNPPMMAAEIAGWLDRLKQQPALELWQ